MAKINILDSSIYNRIAAGEVVERPASAVKEFIENSLDAGAKHITVRIERGGKDLIYVADDGAGIEKSELPSAFLPHATSKIAKAEDLDAISTLGFRGEALASVGSVANVTLRSRFFESDEADTPVDTLYQQAARLWKQPRYRIIDITAQGAQQLLGITQA